jgi:hypothetical protein
VFARIAEILERIGLKKKLAQIVLESDGHQLLLVVVVLLGAVAIVASIYNYVNSEYTGVVVRRRIVRHHYEPADPGHEVCSAMPRAGGGVSIQCRTEGDHPARYWLILEDGDWLRVGSFHGCPMGSYYAEREYCGPIYCWWASECEGSE